METIGYNVLGTIGGFLLLALLLVVPAGAALGVLWAGNDLHGSAGISLAVGGGAVFVVLTGLELALLFRWLGGVYDDVDAGELLEPA